MGEKLSLEQYHVLLEELPGVITYVVELGEENKTIYISPQIRDIMGYSQEEWLTDPELWIKQLHPDDRESIVQEVFAKNDTGESFFLEYRTFTKTGREIWLRNDARYISTVPGDVKYVHGFMLDISDRKNMEKKLWFEKVRYEAMVSEMSSGVAVYEAVDDGHDFIFTDYNSSAQKIDRLSRTEVLGKKVTEVFPGVKEFGLLDVFRRVYRTGKPEHCPISEYKDERIDGWRENYIYKLPTGELVAIYDDVTDRKRLENEREKLLIQLQEKNKKLKELDSLKDEFLALISHELRTPLTVIDGAAGNLLESYSDRLPEDVNDYLEMIVDSTARLDRMVNNLLNLAILGAGKVTIHKSEHDLVGFTRKQCEKLVVVADEKKIKFSYDLPSSPVMVQFDKMWLGQVISNLVSNAVKYTPDTGKITVALETQGDAVKCTISDTGIGISKPEQKNIFEKFSRGDWKIQYNRQGIGLGLAIAREIIGLHEGTIGVESEVGRGSLFYFTLPYLSTAKNE